MHSQLTNSVEFRMLEMGAHWQASLFMFPRQSQLLWRCWKAFLSRAFSFTHLAWSLNLMTFTRKIQF